MRKFILAAVFCAPLLLVAAPAGDLRMAAEQGDAAAQCRLGLAYASGEGVARDAKEAVKWWRLAAQAKGRRIASANGFSTVNALRLKRSASKLAWKVSAFIQARL